jgi:hypothetical protein
MISGLARLSIRSVTATATFFVTAVITTRLLYGNFLPPIGPIDWSAGPHIKTFLALQAASLALEAVYWFFAAKPSAPENTPPNEETPLASPAQRAGSRVLRALTSLLTGFHFSIALRLSNLVSSLKVTSFLLTPFDAAFDPSLIFVAIGALPLGILFYRYVRPRDPVTRETPRLGGKWTVSTRCDVDRKLFFGAAIFGVGWGMAGICPAPGLINFGRVLAAKLDPTQQVVWLFAMILGGLVEL